MNSMTENRFCPVCGKEQTEENNCACLNCNFAYAFVTYFAGEAGRALWKQKAYDYKEKVEFDLRKQAEPDKLKSNKNTLVVGRDSVGYISADTKRLRVVFGDGRKAIEEENVDQYLSNDSNLAILYADGTVKVYGDNTYGQCDVGNYSDIVDIAMSASCIYMVNNDGRVTVAGSIESKMKNAIVRWKDIKTIFASERLVIEITNTGEIKVTASIDSSRLNRIKEWNGAKKICLRGRESVALFDDGTVRVFGADKEAEDWKEITDIAYDGTYIIGLTSQKTIKLAGKARNEFLDAGRKEADAWTDIESISCSKTAIAGYDTCGDLLIAGKMGTDIDSLKKEWNRTIKKIL